MLTQSNLDSIYQQLAENGRVIDLKGAVLNLPRLHRLEYVIKRVRQSRDVVKAFKVFTDSFYAVQLIQGYHRFFRGQFQLEYPVFLERVSARKTVDPDGFTTKLMFVKTSLESHIVTHLVFDGDACASRIFGHGNGHRLWMVQDDCLATGIIESLESNVILANFRNEVPTVDDDHGDYGDYEKMHVDPMCELRKAAA